VNLTFETWPIDRLVGYARNPRKNDHAVDDVAAAIREFGFRVPVVAKSDGTVVDGHLRLKAAKKLGLTEIPVILADDMTDAQIKAFRLSVNKVAEFADWDIDLLKLEFADLKDMDFDLSLTGFKLDEIADMLAEPTEGLTDEDAVPDAPETPVTVPGDVWVLGRHRLMCGDSTNADDVAKALNGVQPHLMVTDPPYGVEYDASWRPKLNKIKPGFSTGKHAEGVVMNDERADWSEAWALFPGDVAYIWHAGNKAHIVATSLEACGLDIRAQIIWAKNNMVIGRGDYHPKHEPCWYAVRKNRKGHYRGGRKQTTVWNIDKPMKSETGHSTQKPVECMKRPIENNSSPGQAIYEPFSGSGTTIIACEQTDRACHAIELNPAYVDMAIIRWQDFTGEQAVLEATGETYADLHTSRVEKAIPDAA
jgi:DNA modification methylase